MGIDFWSLKNSDGNLYHFGEDLSWINPVYHRQLMENGNKEKLEMIDRLNENKNPNYDYPIAKAV